MLINIIVLVIAILLNLKIILTLKTGKNVSRNEITKIKSFIGTLTSNLKDTERNLKDEFVTNRKKNSEAPTGLRTEIGNKQLKPKRN